MIEKILVCLDGEEHSRRAEEYAIFLARATKAHLTALHVEDPYLKQFHHEIYAQGRREYVAYVDNLLRDRAARILEDFRRSAQAAGIDYTAKARHGPPLEEIIKELQETRYDLIVVGGKQLHGLDKFKSGNLPGKLEKAVEIPLLIVKQQ